MAGSRTQLKVAFVGKGGSGKSVIAGTLCRHLARHGLPVLALDVDTMPGMAASLGVAAGEARLPTGLAERVEGKGWQVISGAGPARLVDRYAIRGPDDLRLLELGKLPGRVEPATTVAFRYVMERFRRPGWCRVADLAAGTRQAMFGWASFAHTVLVVAEPSAKSLISARRLALIGTHLLANKVRSEDDIAWMRAHVDLPLAAAIPYDEALGEADRRGGAPIDLTPDAPAVEAVKVLALRLLEELR